MPVVGAAGSDWRGELVLGLHSDFGWRFVRAPDSGRVAFLGAKAGYRQFLGHGLHIDATINAGWRHEEDNPWDGKTIHSFQGRLWTFAGYQHDFGRQLYVNLRGGLGIHLFRTDRFAAKEKPAAAGGDVNLGWRF